MTSVPLLAARRGAGMGPKVPVRHRVCTALVEGLSAGDVVRILTEKEIFVLQEDGAHPLPDGCIVSGDIVSAEVQGENSCVSVWME